MRSVSSVLSLSSSHLQCLSTPAQVGFVAPFEYPMRFSVTRSCQKHNNPYIVDWHLLEVGATQQKRCRICIVHWRTSQSEALQCNN
uniref:Secreted protein n=1 Tax=Echinococcus granulosus TaxID=6210 RepID=A0A068X545_ECHGR|nr:hypothetical protein EgrG_002055700 [Echinococcus granulosus]